MIRTSLKIVTLILILLVSTSSLKADTTDDLIKAVQRLNTWLGEGEGADQWRRQLDLNTLESQAVLGPRANAGTVQGLLARFDAAPGHPAFRDVRNCLQQHLNVLDQSSAVDLKKAMEDAAGQFKQPSRADVDRLRDNAMYHAQVLKKFYEATKDKSESDEILMLVGVDEMLQKLESIEFVLPPEESAGKLADQIASLEGQQNALTEKLDALQVNDATKAERERLEKEIANFQPEIDALKKKRTDILASDRPRLIERARIVRDLRTHLDGFEKAVELVQDAYIASSKQSFEHFLNFYINATNDNLERRFRDLLDDLREDLEQIDSGNDRDAAARLGTTLGDLERQGQVPGLIAAIRARYSKPNLKIEVTEALLNELSSKPVNDVQPVAETILGRFIQGQACVNGNVNIDLIENPNEAQISIWLRSDLNSSTYTKSGPITAYAGSNAQIEARRSIYAGLGGLIINDPYAAANLNSNFRGVNCRLRLINRIANKQYLKDKYLSEGISASRLENRVINQFQSQTSEQLEPAKQQLRDFKKRVMPIVAALPVVHLHTSSNRVLADAIRVSPLTIGATAEPIAGVVQPEISFKVHESIAGNYANPFFAGKRYTSTELGNKIAELTSSSVPAFEGEEWEIVFSRNRPIQLEFEDNIFRLVVKGRQFRQPGKRPFNKQLQIRIQFKIVRQNGQLKLIRDGKAEVIHEDENSKDGASVAFAGFLTEKLNEEPGEGEESLSQDIDLPENFIPLDDVPELADSPVARNLRLVECRAENGWLYLGWNHVAENSYESSVVDTPAIHAAVVTTSAPAADGAEIAAPVEQAEVELAEPPQPDNE